MNQKSYSKSILNLILLLASIFFVSGCEMVGGGGVLQTQNNQQAGEAMRLASISSELGIGACVNMANHLEAPNEGDWGRAISETDFADIAAVGFNTVRLPVRFSAHAQHKAPFMIAPAFMDRVEHLVNLARKSGLRVIVNVHNYDELFDDPQGHTLRFTFLWQQIAKRFRNQDDDVWFELINEPHGALNNQNLRSVIDPAFLAVRASNPTRKVVIGGENWSGVNSLATLDLPDDPNVIATFHYYEPFAFTHQGARWIDPVPPMGKTFGSAADIKALEKNIDKVHAFTARTKTHVFMGEFGAYESVSMQQRVQYYRTVHQYFQKAGIDGCVWGYTNSFPIRIGSTWVEELLGAIGL